MARTKKLSNGSRKLPDLDVGDLKIIQAVTGYRYDTVQKVMNGLRNSKMIVKVAQALPVAKAEMIEKLKAQAQQ